MVAGMDGRIDGNSIEVSQNLYEFGIDSLATVSLLVALAEETNTDLEDIIDELETPRTVFELVSLAERFLLNLSVDG